MAANGKTGVTIVDKFATYINPLRFALAGFVVRFPAQLPFVCELNHKIMSCSLTDVVTNQNTEFQNIITRL